MTVGLVEYLKARIAEDELVARSVRPNEHPHTREDTALSVGITGVYPAITATSGRVLAECAAKRAIIDMERTRSQPAPYLHNDQVTNCGGHPGPFMPHGDYGPGRCQRADEDNRTLRWLATPYSGRGDFNSDWSVTE